MSKDNVLKINIFDSILQHIEINSLKKFQKKRHIRLMIYKIHKF